MKEYFIRLFNYDKHTNLLITQAIIEAGSPEKPVQLMSHLLTAQQVWLTRCKGEPPIGTALWPDCKANALEQTINDNHRGWINFLEYLSPDDFYQIISYRNFKGDSWESKLSDILAHVINHGTHHRAQAGQHLILAGVESLPVTDYIFYIRELNN